MNAFGVVAEFERRVSEYADARFGVAVDCCTSALFLSLQYIRLERANTGTDITLPARTYISAAAACVHAGFDVRFEDYPWLGVYQLRPFDVWDGAKRFRRGMYQGGLHCLSFHSKKILNIGRGGMVLTDDADAAAWLRKARYDGRDGLPYPQESISFLGWHVYMTPEQAARGMQLLDVLPEGIADQTEDYPDLRQFPVFRESMRRAA